MSSVTVHLCPETGICTILKEGGTKVDLVPSEVQALRGSSDNDEAIRKVLSKLDGDFAQALTAEEIDTIAKSV